MTPTDETLKPSGMPLAECPDLPSDSSKRATSLLLAIAALLIANSHLEAFYPVPWMAADGLLGNSMFFLLSGYGLMCSEARQHRDFLSYYLRRIGRIYPTLVVVVLAFDCIAAGGWQTWTAGEYVQRFVYPTEYGFVTLIMIFYVPFYFLARLRRLNAFLWVALLLCVPYAWLYLTDIEGFSLGKLQLGARSPSLWWVFFFQVMLFGGWLSAKPAGLPTCRAVTRAAAVLGGSFALYVGLKFAMVKGLPVPGTSVSLANFYPLLHLLTLVVIGAGFLLGIRTGVMERIGRVPAAAWAISLVGAMSLEVYLVHIHVLRWKRVQSIVFPLNLVVFFALTLLLCWTVSRGIDWLQQRIRDAWARTQHKGTE